MSDTFIDYQRDPCPICGGTIESHWANGNVVNYDAAVRVEGVLYHMYCWDNRPTESVANKHTPDAYVERNPWVRRVKHAGST